jgi:serine/threonine protein kinase
MGEHAPGSKISGRYRLERLVGEGGMGEVWVASHLVTRKVVALKVMKQERALKHEFVQRFFLEARAATAVQHPNVIQVHDVFYHRGSPVMVMDYLNGESLAARLERDEKISLPELASILVPVLSAVGTAHTLGIVHRDLKPENIFLAKNRSHELEPKVLDFGIAKLSHFDVDAGEPAPLTRTGTMMGTLHYMSPEQASGEKVDQGADVWAMGVILFECLAGRRPFAGDNFGQVFKAIVSSPFPKLSKLCPDLPEDVEKLIARMLEKDRMRRCTDLREPFEILSRHTTVETRPFGVPRSSMPAESPWGNGPAAPLKGELTDVDQSGPPSSGPSANGDVTFLESVASHTPMPTGRRTGTFLVVGVGVAVLAIGSAAVFASLGGVGLSAPLLNGSSQGVRVPTAPAAPPVAPVVTNTTPEPEVVPRVEPSSLPSSAPMSTTGKPAHLTGASGSSAAPSSVHGSGKRGGRPKRPSAVSSATAVPPAPPDQLGLPEKPF